jgi:G8 domain.
MMTRTNAATAASGLLLALVLAMPSGSARAQNARSCLGDVVPQHGLLRAEDVADTRAVLPPQQDGADLTVTTPCIVKAGTYKFHDVHILDQGRLIFTDARIDFWAANILVEDGGSLVAGSPQAPIGTDGGVVTIHLWGADQTGSDPKKQGIGIACISDNVGRCGVPDEIWQSNVDAMGMPVPVSKARKIASLAAAKQYPGVTDDYFYAYQPLTFDGGSDATHPVGYFGYKVLGVSYGGTLQLFGKKGATYAIPECGDAPTTSGTSWARLDRSAAKGANTLTVDRPMSLQAGDRIVVTTTDYLPGHSEQLTVATDVACGTTIAVKEGLAYSHYGARFPLTVVPADVGLDPRLRAAGAETRAAVGVLTRSIRIVSAGDTMNDDFPPEPPAGPRHPATTSAGT